MPNDPTILSLLMLLGTQIGSAVWIIATLRSRVLAVENDALRAWRLAARAHTRIDDIVGLHCHRRAVDPPLPEPSEDSRHEQK